VPDVKKFMNMPILSRKIKKNNNNTESPVKATFSNRYTINININTYIRVCTSARNMNTGITGGHLETEFWNKYIPSLARGKKK
jgi:hypothetical protein